MYEYSMQIGIAHVGCDGKAKLGAAADILQNGSWFQMDTERPLKAYFRAHDVGLFLVYKQLDIHRLPEYGEYVTIKSWIYKSSRILGERNTLLYDREGNVLIASAELGSFVSLQTGMPARIPQQIADDIALEEPFAMNVLPRKITIPEGLAEPVTVLTVLGQHLDSYGHMNNVRYIEAALANLPVEQKISRVRAEYKKPAQAGEQLACALYATDRYRLVCFENERGEINAVVEFEFA